jgi:ABC-type glycerol-3-phosphate transport system substrate-binding protein
MKKSTQRKLAMTLGLLMSVAPASACFGPGGDSSLRDGATPIYVAFYNGGLGADWLTKMAEAFETKHPEYQIMPQPGVSTMDSTAVLDNFDTYDGDLFFIDYMGSADLAQYRKNGYFADISKYVKQDKIEDETKTIWDKISPAIKDYYDNDGTVDCLPW